jgi:phosphatidylglycerophosphate synthase
MNPKHWPNIVSVLRIALMPAVLAAAIAGSRSWFVVLIVITLSTDALDGMLARWLDAYSELGRKLDSVADYLTMIIGLAGITLLWPEVVHRELLWIVTGLVAFFIVVVYGFVRLGRAPCYHTWASKALAVACALSLIPLLSGGSPLPFRVVIVLQVLAALEEVVIVMLVPWHVGQVATVWHARQIRHRHLASPAPGVHAAGGQT